MEKFADWMDRIAESVTEGYQQIEHGVVDGYKKIETSVVGGYKKVETGAVEGFGKIAEKASVAMMNEDGSLKTGKVGKCVVGGYHKIEDAFVNTFLAREGESVEDAKARIASVEKERDAQAEANGEKDSFQGTRN